MSESLQLRSVHLRVSDLARSAAFYSDQLGFRLSHSGTQRADFATVVGAPTLLTLTEDRSARPPPRDAAGLFHVALLLPTRAALGSWLQKTANTGVKFDGFSDHGVSEAIYLADPDGNGLEFYADRARDRWLFRNGELQMGTEPLALPELLAAGMAQIEPPLTGARWGHLHLRVAALERSEAFYCLELGVVPTQRYGSSARFLAADGYHHHIGLNTWGGVRQSQPSGSLGLVEAIFARSGTSAEVALRDPDHIAIRVTPDKET
jgi:catechol 2,3-dioxygenase